MGPFPNPLQRYYFFLTYANKIAFFCIFFAFFYNQPQRQSFITSLNLSLYIAKSIPHPRTNHPKPSQHPRRMYRSGRGCSAGTHEGLTLCGASPAMMRRILPAKSYIFVSYMRKMRENAKKISLSLAYIKKKQYLCRRIKNMLL